MCHEHRARRCDCLESRTGYSFICSTRPGGQDSVGQSAVIFSSRLNPAIRIREGNSNAPAHGESGWTNRNDRTPWRIQTPRRRPHRAVLPMSWRQTLPAGTMCVCVSPTLLFPRCNSAHSNSSRPPSAPLWGELLNCLVEYLDASITMFGYQRCPSGWEAGPVSSSLFGFGGAVPWQRTMTRWKK